MAKQSAQHDTMRALYRIGDKLDAQWLAGGFDDVSAAAATIRKGAAALSRIAESECNGIMRWDDQARRMLASWTDDDQARADKREAKARASILAAFDSILSGRGESFTVNFQSDPRGAPVRFYYGKAKGESEESRSADVLF